MGYTNWRANEPNGKRGENYLTMDGSYGERNLGEWNDIAEFTGYPIKPLCQYF